VDALSQIGLVAAQGSSTWPSVCVESWGSLSIFPRVSWRQLLKHYSLWESLLLGTGVQLVVSYTAIEAQIVFEILLALVAGQLSIAGQLGREVHPWSIGLLLGSGGQR